MVKGNKDVNIAVGTTGVELTKAQLKRLEQQLAGMNKKTAMLSKGGFVGLDHLSMFGKNINDQITKPMKRVQETSVNTAKIINQELGNLDKVGKAIQSESIMSQKEFDRTAKSAQKNGGIIKDAAFMEPARSQKDLQRMLVSTQKQLRTAFAEGKNIDPMLKRIETLKTRMDRISKASSQTQRQFEGWALSVMFFGMALKRVFDMAWKSSSKTFNEVMHSVEGTVTGFDILQGSMAFLGFAIGGALEPIAYHLSEIIWKVADWVTQNETLVANLLLAFGIGGSVLMGLGMVKLGLNGINDLVKIISFGKFSGLAAVFSNPAVLAGIAALTALGAISWKAFSETPEAWKAVKDSVSRLKTPLMNFKNSIADIIEQAWEVDDVWDKIAWTIGWGVNNAVYMLETLFNAIAAIYNVLAAVEQMARAALSALFSKETAADYVKQATTNWNNAKDAFSGLMDVMDKGGENLALGPMGFKEQQLALQAAERQLQLQKDIAKYGQLISSESSTRDWSTFVSLPAPEDLMSMPKEQQQAGVVNNQLIINGVDVSASNPGMMSMVEEILMSSKSIS